MPLTTVPKAQSVNSNTPSRVVSRQEVQMGKPSASTARVQALKDRLTNKAPAQPIAPRPAGSSARREEISKLNKFTTPIQTAPQPPPAIKQNTSARQDIPDFNSIELPPSGLVKGSESSPPLANSVEAPKTGTEAPSDPLSPQYVALARKERQLRKAQQEFKAAQDAWKQEQANYIPKARLSSETLKVLAEAGITPDKLVELQTHQAETADPNQALHDKIAQLEGKLAALTDPENGELAKRDKAAYEQAVKQIKSDASLLVDSNPAYGTIKSEGRTDDVVELITRVFDDEGIILDVEEAARLVEDKLVDRLVKQYDRISKYEKIKAKLGQTAETPSEANTEKQSPPQQPKTLTNAGAIERPLSPRDRAILKVQEAMDARKGR